VGAPAKAAAPVNCQARGSHGYGAAFRIAGLISVCKLWCAPREQGLHQSGYGLPPLDLEHDRAGRRTARRPGRIRPLDLGRELALSFVEQELPNDYDRAEGFFYSKGAYGRFKTLLESRGVMEKWYAFEARATEAKLREWCHEHGVQVSHANPAF
jgi:hypothetical protein